MLAVAGEKTSMLPGVRSEQGWLSSDNSAGIKVCIEDQMDNVMEQLNNIVLEQLGGTDPRAVSLASTLLAHSMSFVHELCNYVTLTLAELKVAGYDKRDYWFLVSKLIYRMFAIDFFKVRSAVGEGLDIDKSDELKSRKTLARRALWGVLQTHMRMKEYLRVGIKNHPSISSEYVRFLIQKSAVGKVEKLQSQNAMLESRLTEVETIAKEAKRKGETALNRADEAKKLCTKNK